MSSLALSSFAKLPKEILISILGHVKTDCNASLQQCILCCNEWRDAALPLLYRDVRLTTSNLDAFCKTLNVMHSGLVRSLAFMIDPIQPAKDAASPHFYNCIEDPEYMNYHGSRESRAPTVETSCDGFLIMTLFSPSNTDAKRSQTYRGLLGTLTSSISPASIQRALSGRMRRLSATNTILLVSLAAGD